MNTIASRDQFKTVNKDSPIGYSVSKGPHRVFLVPGTLLGIEPKNYHRRQCVVLEIVPLRGENNFKPNPPTRIFVPLRGLSDFKNFP